MTAKRTAKTRAKRKASEPKKLPIKPRAFTDKQQRLIDCYAGDAKEAAKKAGISYGYARQLLTKSNILATIQNRQETEIRPKTIADRQERQKFWTKIMRSRKEETKDQLKASELLGKSEADFTENLAHRFPEGCGVLVVGGLIDAEQWKRQSQAHHANRNARHTG